MANERRVDYAITATDTATAVYKKWKAEVDTGNKQIAGSFVDATGKLQAYGKETNSLTNYVRAQRAEQRQQNFFINEMRDAVSAAGLAVNIFSGMLGRGNSQVRELTNGLNAGIVAFQGINAVTGLLPGPWGLALSVIGGVAAALFTVGTESEEVTKKFHDTSLAIIDLKIKLGELPIAAKISELQTDLVAAEQKFKDLSREMQFNLAVQDEFGAGGETIITKTVGSKEDIAEAERAVLQLRLAIQELQGPYGPMPPPVVESIEKSVKVILGYRERELPILKRTTIELQNIQETVNTTAAEAKVHLSDLSAGAQAFTASMHQGISVITDEIGIGMRQAFEDTFGEANSLLEKFVEAALESIARIAAQMLATSIVSSIFGVLGIPFLFHQGGTIPKAHDGMFINAPPSREFPILVRGGETVRTERQEENVQRSLNGGGGITINVFGNNIATPGAFKEIVEQGMQQLGITDVTKYFINNRSRIALT